jgi:hypothetical protein
LRLVLHARATSRTSARQLIKASTRGGSPVRRALRAEPGEVSMRLLRRWVELKRAPKIFSGARYVPQTFTRNTAIEVGKCKALIKRQSLRKGFRGKAGLAGIEIGVPQIVGNERIAWIELERTPVIDERQCVASPARVDVGAIQMSRRDICGLVGARANIGRATTQLPIRVAHLIAVFDRPGACDACPDKDQH